MARQVYFYKRRENTSMGLTTEIPTKSYSSIKLVSILIKLRTEAKSGSLYDCLVGDMSH